MHCVNNIAAVVNQANFEWSAGNPLCSQGYHGRARQRRLMFVMSPSGGQHDHDDEYRRAYQANFSLRCGMSESLASDVGH